ncbi:sodium- and chloride-dependent neutral and basic amino acid transporter B(0+) [Gadus chalcogrammus]|uniref:sodium- and chloride-dependent neutral and basic amino acid transporter B(0+) n=1 Tax=Gadus chalcogrammus TaxID=1042646 RepID=UPI0024C48344|nr:sodium- and chloride-dependent neutral and basic amino acid transporter B(0+) [Gadus chalcogrammus]
MGKKIIHSSGDIVLRNQAIADQDISGSDDSEREEDENTVRGNWTNKREYLLSMIGMAVGLGNIWRFPYLAYKNGGGAFLIPYFIMLICLGVPLYFLETALGQFCSQGPINTWSAVPLLQGVGMAGLIGNVMVSIYYGVILSYTLYYLFASFQYPLPWTNVLDGVNCTSPQHVAVNVTSMSVSNWTRENCSCSTSNIITSLTEQYWDQVVLQRSSGLGETGSIVWQLALCLLLSSIIIAAVLLKGIKSSGKVVYFTATFPYVVLTILLIRGLTLEGAKDGIDFYIGSKSNLTKLAEIEVWRDAATQIFYSLSVGFGGVTALSSYNKFQNNLVVDTFLICIINCATSIFAGFAIFSILGYMAHIYGIPIEEVTKEGFGLAFIVYPAALANLPISPLWSILFFLMLFTLGLDSQFAGMELITTCLHDAFPKYIEKKRALIAIVTCAFMFLLGLPCVTQAGIYWVTLIDHFVAGWVVLVIGFLEVFGIFYIYGGRRFIKDIEMMIGTKSVWFWLYWRLCWYFITPFVTLIILVLSLAMSIPPTYGTVEYPAWGLDLGWCMAVFCIVLIPATALYKLAGAQGSFRKRLRLLCSPSEDWHPYLDVHRGERYSQERFHTGNVVDDEPSCRTCCLS